MRESAAERHDRLLELVRRHGTARVSDLAARLGVSPVTVRRDVEFLATEGRLDRAHGSVSWPDAGNTASAAGLPAGTPRQDRGPGATAPAGSRELVIGMLAPNATYYFAEVIRGAHEAAAAAGARLVLRISDYRPQEDAGRAAGLLAAGADGLLIAPGWKEPDDPVEHGAWIAGLPVPTVLLERRGVPGSELDDLDRVCSDHGHGVLVAVRHLLGLGHPTPLLVARSDSPTAIAVRAGYRHALDALGLKSPLPVIDSVSAEADPSGFEGAVRAVRTAVAEGSATAALVHNDVDAIRLVQRLAELGVRVPDDLALVAYDDEVAALADTPLTAVAPPKHEVGRYAAELLIERLRGTAAHGPGGEAAPRRHVDLLPRLRVRASCGAPSEPLRSAASAP
ncbi:substrate-binding domain-containing protein [Streptomyces sp. NBC_00083]|uniref:substrate-binding domain-containing protein n=1 Tax=Streptomyces sp. NBC_00083 TaxID=2975647 RepID=UPI0022580A21|nr:substrate-binding domain-containing protein [Streptomyces sp. NBC_00083]MCX5385105.1 substrate-binding domain-containing protein [Streptomyces sp. NBC_00083]